MLSSAVAVQHPRRPAERRRGDAHRADGMARVVLAVAEGALAVLPRLAPVDRREPSRNACGGKPRMRRASSASGQSARRSRPCSRRRVMEQARRLAQLRDPADQHVALGGMQIAARRIHAQRPARAARLLPRRERERVFEQPRKRAQVHRRARHRAARDTGSRTRAKPAPPRARAPATASAPRPRSAGTDRAGSPSPARRARARSG